MSTIAYLYSKPSNNDRLESEPNDLISDDVNSEGKSEDNMSDTQISKDWAERRLSELDHKIDAHRKDWEADVKDMNHKFEMLMASSNDRFDKLFMQMKHDSEKTELLVKSSIADVKIWTILTLVTLISLGLGALRYLDKKGDGIDSIRSPAPISAPSSNAESAVQSLPETPPAKQIKPK